MEQLFTSLDIQKLLTWRLKGHPFWTSFLKGYWIGFIVLIILVLVRLSKNEAVLATFGKDVQLTLIIGTVCSIALLTFTGMQQFYFPDKE